MALNTQRPKRTVWRSLGETPVIRRGSFKLSWRAAIIAGVVVLCLFGIAYAYDATQKNQIADGVTVGGVKVGGLSEAQARQVLQQRLVAPLQRPIEVSAGGKTYTLSPNQLNVHADINGMVNAAVSASRSGGFLGRTFRYITFGSVDKKIQPQIAYSSAAVNSLVSKVTRDANVPPRDASVSPTPSSLQVVKARDGRSVQEADLRRQVDAVVRGYAPAHVIAAHFIVTKPKVLTGQVAAAYPTYLTLDRGQFTLSLFKHLKKVKSYPVAVGMQGLSTPAGTYHIQDKQVDPSWQVPNSSWAGSLAGRTIPPGPQDPLKARWLGIFNGAGIHGTDETSSIGHAFSHGCVRMLIPDVIDLYPRVPVGTPIYIGD